MPIPPTSDQSASFQPSGRRPVAPTTAATTPIHNTANVQQAIRNSAISTPIHPIQNVNRVTQNHNQRFSLTSTAATQSQPSSSSSSHRVQHLTNINNSSTVYSSTTNINTQNNFNNNTNNNNNHTHHVNNTPSASTTIHNNHHIHSFTPTNSGGNNSPYQPITTTASSSTSSTSTVNNSSSSSLTNHFISPNNSYQPQQQQQQQHRGVGNNNNNNNNVSNRRRFGGQQPYQPQSYQPYQPLSHQPYQPQQYHQPSNTSSQLQPVNSQQQQQQQYQQPIQQNHQSIPPNPSQTNFSAAPTPQSNNATPYTPRYTNPSPITHTINIQATPYTPPAYTPPSQNKPTNTMNNNNNYNKRPNNNNNNNNNNNTSNGFNSNDIAHNYSHSLSTNTVASSQSNRSNHNRPSQNQKHQNQPQQQQNQQQSSRLTQYQSQYQQYAPRQQRQATSQYVNGNYNNNQHQHTSNQWRNLSQSRLSQPPQQSQHPHPYQPLHQTQLSQPYHPPRNSQPSPQQQQQQQQSFSRPALQQSQQQQQSSPAQPQASQQHQPLPQQQTSGPNNTFVPSTSTSAPTPTSTPTSSSTTPLSTAPLSTAPLSAAPLSTAPSSTAPSSTPPSVPNPVARTQYLLDDSTSLALSLASTNDALVIPPVLPTPQAALDTRSLQASLTPILESDDRINNSNQPSSNVPTSSSDVQPPHTTSVSQQVSQQTQSRWSPSSGAADPSSTFAATTDGPSSPLNSALQQQPQQQQQQPTHRHQLGLPSAPLVSHGVPSSVTPNVISTAYQLPPPQLDLSPVALLPIPTSHSHSPPPLSISSTLSRVQHRHRHHHHHHSRNTSSSASEHSTHMLILDSNSTPAQDQTVEGNQSGADDLLEDDCLHPSSPCDNVVVQNDDDCGEGRDEDDILSLRLSCDEDNNSIEALSASSILSAMFFPSMDAYFSFSVSPNVNANIISLSSSSLSSSSSTHSHDITEDISDKANFPATSINSSFLIDSDTNIIPSPSVVLSGTNSEPGHVSILEFISNQFLFFSLDHQLHPSPLDLLYPHTTTSDYSDDSFSSYTSYSSSSTTLNSSNSSMGSSIHSILCSESTPIESSHEQAQCDSHSSSDNKISSLSTYNSSSTESSNATLPNLPCPVSPKATEEHNTTALVSQSHYHHQPSTSSDENGTSTIAFSSWSFGYESQQTPNLSFSSGPWEDDESSCLSQSNPSFAHLDHTQVRRCNTALVSCGEPRRESIGNNERRHNPKALSISTMQTTNIDADAADAGDSAPAVAISSASNSISFVDSSCSDGQDNSSMQHRSNTTQSSSQFASVHPLVHSLSSSPSGSSSSHSSTSPIFMPKTHRSQLQYSAAALCLEPLEPHLNRLWTPMSLVHSSSLRHRIALFHQQFIEYHPLVRPMPLPRFGFAQAAVVLHKNQMKTQKRMKSLTTSTPSALIAIASQTFKTVPHQSSSILSKHASISPLPSQLYHALNQSTSHQSSHSLSHAALSINLLIHHHTQTHHDDIFDVPLPILAAIFYLIGSNCCYSHDNSPLLFDLISIDEQIIHLSKLFNQKHLNTSLPLSVSELASIAKRYPCSQTTALEYLMTNKVITHPCIDVEFHNNLQQTLTSISTSITNHQFEQYVWFCVDQMSSSCAVHLPPVTASTGILLPDFTFVQNPFIISSPQNSHDHITGASPTLKNSSSPSYSMESLQSPVLSISRSFDDEEHLLEHKTAAHQSNLAVNNVTLFPSLNGIYRRDSCSSGLSRHDRALLAHDDESLSIIHDGKHSHTATTSIAPAAGLTMQSHKTTFSQFKSNFKAQSGSKSTRLTANAYVKQRREQQLESLQQQSQTQTLSSPRVVEPRLIAVASSSSSSSSCSEIVKLSTSTSRRYPPKLHSVENSTPRSKHVSEDDTLSSLDQQCCGDGDGISSISKPSTDDDHTGLKSSESDEDDCSIELKSSLDDHEEVISNNDVTNKIELVPTAPDTASTTGFDTGSQDDLDQPTVSLPRIDSTHSPTPSSNTTVAYPLVTDSGEQSAAALGLIVRPWRLPHDSYLDMVAVPPSSEMFTAAASGSKSSTTASVTTIASMDQPSTKLTQALSNPSPFPIIPPSTILSSSAFVHHIDTPIAPVGYHPLPAKYDFSPYFPFSPRHNSANQFNTALEEPHSLLSSASFPHNLPDPIHPHLSTMLFPSTTGRQLQQPSAVSTSTLPDVIMPIASNPPPSLPIQHISQSPSTTSAPNQSLFSNLGLFAPIDSTLATLSANSNQHVVTRGLVPPLSSIVPFISPVPPHFSSLPLPQNISSTGSYSSSTTHFPPLSNTPASSSPITTTMTTAASTDDSMNSRAATFNATLGTAPASTRPLHQPNTLLIDSPSLLFPSKIPTAGISSSGSQHAAFSSSRTLWSPLSNQRSLDLFPQPISCGLDGLFRNSAQQTLFGPSAGDQSGTASTSLHGGIHPAPTLTSTGFQSTDRSYEHIAQAAIAPSRSAGLDPADIDPAPSKQHLTPVSTQTMIPVIEPTVLTSSPTNEFSPHTGGVKLPTEIAVSSNNLDLVQSVQQFPLDDDNSLCSVAYQQYLDRFKKKKQPNELTIPLSLEEFEAQHNALFLDILVSSQPTPQSFNLNKNCETIQLQSLDHQHITSPYPTTTDQTTQHPTPHQYHHQRQQSQQQQQQQQQIQHADFSPSLFSSRQFPPPFSTTHHQVSCQSTPSIFPIETPSNSDTPTNIGGSQGYQSGVGGHITATSTTTTTTTTAVVPGATPITPAMFDSSLSANFHQSYPHHFSSDYSQLSSHQQYPQDSHRHNNYPQQSGIGQPHSYQSISNEYATPTTHTTHRSSQQIPMKQQEQQEQQHIDYPTSNRQHFQPDGYLSFWGNNSPRSGPQPTISSLQFDAQYVDVQSSSVSTDRYQYPQQYQPQQQQQPPQYQQQQQQEHQDNISRVSHPYSQHQLSSAPSVTSPNHSSTPSSSERHPIHKLAASKHPLPPHHPKFSLLDLQKQHQQQIQQKQEQQRREQQQQQKEQQQKHELRSRQEPQFSSTSTSNTTHRHQHNHSSTRLKQHARDHRTQSASEKSTQLQAELMFKAALFTPSEQAYLDYLKQKTISHSSKRQVQHQHQHHQHNFQHHQHVVAPFGMFSGGSVHSSPELFEQDPLTPLQRRTLQRFPDGTVVVTHHDDFQDQNSQKQHGSDENQRRAKHHRRPKKATSRFFTPNGIPIVIAGPPGQDPNNVKQELLKTELCLNFCRYGKCDYGNRCFFAHGVSQLRSKLRSTTFKSQPCPHPVRFVPGDASHFSHRRDRQQSSTPGFSMTCQYGARCHFAHPFESLRRVATFGGISTPMYFDPEYFEAVDQDFPHILAPWGLYM